MPAPTLTPGRRRFVLIAEQTTALAVVGAMALSAAGVVQLQIVAPHQPRAAAAASLVSAAPVTATVRTVPFGGLSGQLGADGRHRATDGKGAQQITAVSPPETATGYATVGVTWASGADLAERDITVSVRT